MFKKVITISSISVCLITIALFAGSLNPTTDSPENTFVSLTDIYSKIEDNTYATSSRNFAPTTNPDSTNYTLSEIYDLLPTLNAETIIAGNTIMGIEGTYDVSNLTPDQVRVDIAYGTSSVGTREEIVYNDKIVFWNGDEGSPDPTGTYVPDPTGTYVYDGVYDGEPSWKLSDDSFYLFYDSVYGQNYAIAPTKGFLGEFGDCWNHDHSDTDPDGKIFYHGDYSGDLVVFSTVYSTDGTLNPEDAVGTYDYLGVTNSLPYFANDIGDTYELWYSSNYSAWMISDVAGDPPPPDEWINYGDFGAIIGNYSSMGAFTGTAIITAVPY